MNVIRVVVWTDSLVLLADERWHRRGSGRERPAPRRPGSSRSLPCWIYFRWSRELAAIPFYPRTWAYLVGFGLLLVAFHVLAGAAELLGMGAWPATIAAAAALGLYLVYLFRIHRAPGRTCATSWPSSRRATSSGFSSGLRGPARP